jgi:hypothetical protein
VEGREAVKQSYEILKRWDDGDGENGHGRSRYPGNLTAPPGTSGRLRSRVPDREGEEPADCCSDQEACQEPVPVPTAGDDDPGEERCRKEDHAGYDEQSPPAKVVGEDPTGNENRMPASGETAAMRPMIASPAPRACEKRGSTGFFESVVEKMAKKPIRERIYIDYRSGVMERVPVMELLFRGNE